MYFTRIKPSYPHDAGELINFPCSSERVEATVVHFEDKDLCLVSGKLVSCFHLQALYIEYEED